MAHGVRLNPDSFYRDGVLLPQAWWRALDNAQQKSVNGEAGGTWNPASALVVQGAGMWFAGHTALASGSYLRTPNGSGARIEHGDSDYIQLKSGHSAATRTILTTCGGFRDTSAGDNAFRYGSSADAAFSQVGSRCWVELRVHNGGTFTQAVLCYAVLRSHSGVPQHLPFFRVVRVSLDGTLLPLQSGTATGSGYVTPATPGSGAAWYDSGNTKTLTSTIDADTVIDTSKYMYFAEIIDESGVNTVAGNGYFSVASTFNAIPDLRPQ